MSVLNQSGEEQVVECPLCMELLEVDDLHFYPCTCGYQICRFCWNRLLESENGLCPACRKAYPENPADFTPLSQEQVAAIKTEKKAREQKRRNKTMESRKALANVRVVQNNLVFVVGLPVRLADPEVLKRQEYFGKYGKIHKVVINQSTAYAGSQGPSASAYVTYVSPADALRAIQGVNNVTLDGRVLKGSLGTTKYCANFMKNQPCPKPDCMYLHEQGDPNASFTKEEMHAGLHQVYERKLHNQLLAAQRDKPDAHSSNSTGNSSTNAEKGSSKDGNQSNYIPTTVVTSSHINVVNSSKSKKESSSGSGSSGSGSGSGKEAWPSLGSSPPSDSPARKQSSPKPNHNNVNKSQENGTSESSSPTQQQASPQQSGHNSNKNKDTSHTADNGKSRNGNSKKNKSENKSKQKQTGNNSVTNNSETHEQETPADKSTQQETTQTQSSSVFDTYNYLSNELDELESDRHSLLENHDLLDSSDHSLLEDDSRNFLNNANNEVLMMQRHREMLADLVDNHHMMPKRPLTNGYGLDREMSYLANNDRPISQIILENQSILEKKEMLIRERNQRELLMRQNEMLARHNAMVEQKHFMPSSSIGLDSTSELLGANYHPNPNMLPFGMRIDNGLVGSNIVNMPTNNMATNSLSNALGANNVNTMFLLRNQQLMQQSGMANGFDSAQIAQANETRYQADNMDKFFTDFHKGQQMRLLLGRTDDRRFPSTHNMLSAERLEMEHKNRMGSIRGNEGNGSHAAGDGDDDLDFDPFKETQKAFAEMMESEMMQNNVSGGDSERGRHARFPPPGFGSTGFPMHPRPNIQHHTQGLNSNSAMYSDWTQMDPAIMSTSVSYSKPHHHQQQQQQPPQEQQQIGTGLTQQQQELFARFNQMNLQPNGVNKVGVPLMHQWAGVGVGASQKLGWAGATGGAASFPGIPLPPGFTGVPAKQQVQHPAEIIDAK